MRLTLSRALPRSRAVIASSLRTQSRRRHTTRVERERARVASAAHSEHQILLFRLRPPSPRSCPFLDQSPPPLCSTLSLGFTNNASEAQRIRSEHARLGIIWGRVGLARPTGWLCAVTKLSSALIVCPHPTISDAPFLLPATPRPLSSAQLRMGTFHHHAHNPVKNYKLFLGKVAHSATALWRARADSCRGALQETELKPRDFHAPPVLPLISRSKPSPRAPLRALGARGSPAAETSRRAPRRAGNPRCTRPRAHCAVPACDCSLRASP